MTAFFTVSDERYFLGTVALVNSLRLVGHDEEIVVLDCGFTHEQRALLSTACTIVTNPGDGDVRDRVYFKLVAPRTRTDDVAVILDSDLVVTASLRPLLERAAEGAVVAYPDPEFDRWFAEWPDVFGLPSPPRRDVYICSALVVVPCRHFPALLEQWAAACARTATRPTIAEGAEGPAAQADQDALNAVLMCCYPPDTVHLRSPREAPQAEELEIGVDVLDERALTCRFRGVQSVVLHAAFGEKPWFPRARPWHTAYLVLLRRLLTGPDLAVRPPLATVPLWLRQGRAADRWLSYLRYRGLAIRLSERIHGKAHRVLRSAASRARRAVRS